MLDCLGTNDKEKPVHVQYIRKFFSPWLVQSADENPVDAGADL